MKTKYFFQLLVLCLGLAIVAAGTSNVRAECTDQTNFNIKGYCKSDANDGYYIKAGVGIPIARAGFQCKFLQVSNANINKVIFIPYAPGTTGDNEFTSLLNAVSNSSNISAFVSLSNCTAVCDSNNNLVVTVGGSMFTYPCGDYSECINDVSGNGHCMPVGCADMSIASVGYYKHGTDTTPLLWCPHLPISREDKTNGLDAPTITNQACPLAPVPNTPCYFSTCGNGQVDGTEKCDTLIDTSGRCLNCQCGNFVPETVSGALTGRCLTSCVIPPVCSTDTPFIVDCGCSMCPGNEQLMWPEKVQCKLTNTKSLVSGTAATPANTYYELPKICKSCGAAESNGMYRPTIKLRTHGYYRFDLTTVTPIDRTISATCNDLTTSTPQNITCKKTVSSGSVMDMVDNTGVACPAGTYNDTTLNELRRGILSCNLCSGSIVYSPNDAGAGYYSQQPTASHNGAPFYYDGGCHPCEKGLATTNYSGTVTGSSYFCRRVYGLADLNNDGDVTDPGEDLNKYLNTSDADAPYYTRNVSAGCDTDNNGILDTNKAIHRWGTTQTCVPYTFCTDMPTIDNSVYPNCTQITDAPTLAALQTQKPSCPADKITATTTEGIGTVCTPCPTPYKHVNVYIKLYKSNGTTQILDYRTRVSNALSSKYTCHNICDHKTPFYYDDGLGGGLACHSCPKGYTQLQNFWSSTQYSQTIECSQINCPSTMLIYDDTNDGVVNPTCHNCPQGTFELTNTTNWPFAGSKCWPARAYCNNTLYPGNNTKYATGIFFRRVAQTTTWYNPPNNSGALYHSGWATDNVLPFITDNSIYTTDPAVCSCPAGTRYQDDTWNNATTSPIPDYSYYGLQDYNLYRPTVYCVECPTGSDYFFKGAGDTVATCHACAKNNYYQGSGETTPSCHICPQAQPICAQLFNCTLPQYSCNIYGDPEFDPDAWDHLPNCDCRCKLTATSCTGAKPYLNPVLCKCQATSLSAYCGNGVLDAGEECDTTEDGDSYTDTNGVPHINRCIGCKIHRVSGCDSRAYTTWVNGAYTERPVTGQCPASLTSSTNSGAGLTAYSCSFWEPKHIDTVLDPNPAHQSEATSSSGCIFTCQSGYTYNSITKTCGL